MVPTLLGGPKAQTIADAVAEPRETDVDLLIVSTLTLYDVHLLAYHIPSGIPDLALSRMTVEAYAQVQSRYLSPLNVTFEPQRILGGDTPCRAT
jgi:hypothetical protein